MPYKPSPQSKKLGSPIKRPNYNSKPSVCQQCGVRILLPRKSGTLCPKCYKQFHNKEIVDKKTKAFLKRNPQVRRRFQY